MAGSLSLVGIVEAQRDCRHGGTCSRRSWASSSSWCRELPRRISNPFDLPEAESELVAGFHTEYTGMRFALFFLAEYGNMIIISAVGTTLFLGGWLRPFLERRGPFVSGRRLAAFRTSRSSFRCCGSRSKVAVFLFIYIWFRGTFPRYRFDQLMALGWKWLLPMALDQRLFLTAAGEVGSRPLGSVLP